MDLSSLIPHLDDEDQHSSLGNPRNGTNSDTESDSSLGSVSTNSARSGKTFQNDRTIQLQTMVTTMMMKKAL
ncbi:hypothetical protein PtB15_8B625 [Puccinia triticina]|nr:hypothetical protein PtB15_8B625 [Puccinia triticina]